MAKSFFGGIHPKENKHYAENAPVQEYREPDILVIPMAQHIGAPCQPLVKKGDLVTMGQKIGDNQGLCVPVHASVSGKVKAVEMRPHTSGTMMMSVVIENDHQDTLCADIQPRSPEAVAALTAEELIAIIREAGAKVGISIKPGTPVEVLEPYIDKIDMVLVMTVEPGFGGQKYMEACTEKIRQTRRMITERGLNVDVQVDGGITIDNVHVVLEAGANVVVAGSAVFKNDIEENVKNFLKVMK